MKKIALGFAFLLTLALSAPLFAADNQLTDKEKEEGWILLFNGKDYTDWKCNNGKKVKSKIEFDAMQPHKSGGHLVVYKKPFGDFHMKFDVKVDKKNKKGHPANSGLFFRIEDLKNPIHTSLELQILGGGSTGIHSFGSIYDIAPSTKNPTKGDGEWDQVELLCVGPKIVVKINDKVVCQMDCDELDEPGERIGDGKHKFKLDGKPRAVKDFARTGYLGFQDHGDKIWVKNVKLLPLSEEKEEKKETTEETEKAETK